MKKIISILMALVLIFGFTSCDSVNNTNNSNNSSNFGDSLIIATANHHLANFGEYEERVFEVEYDKQTHIYTINANCTYVKIQQQETMRGSRVEGKEVCNNEELSKVVNSSKDLVKKYINSSSILEDKEKLISYIDSIPLYYGKFLDEDEMTAAMYLAKDDCIYISKEHISEICEWMLVHEYVHALAQKTNGGISNEIYAHDVFNEVITDIIAMSTSPKIKNGVVSGYAQYYEIVYLYIGCIGEDAIKAYFYGYDSVIQRLGENYLNLFVLCISKINIEENALPLAHNCINLWQK